MSGIFVSLKATEADGHGLRPAPLGRVESSSIVRSGWGVFACVVHRKRQDGSAMANRQTQTMWMLRGGSAECVAAVTGSGKMLLKCI